LTGYLLDTNVVSELRKRDRANHGVRSWFEEHAGEEIWLSVLVVAELGRGVQLLRRRDATASDQLDEWLASLVARYSDRIIPIDLPIAQRWSTIGIPDPLPIIDGLLAATALHHNLTLVTRNTIDVARSGASHLNPFA
jgi:toxin FitB